jgi:hypothetical protein
MKSQTGWDSRLPLGAAGIVMFETSLILRTVARAQRSERLLIYVYLNLRREIHGNTCSPTT